MKRIAILLVFLVGCGDGEPLAEQTGAICGPYTCQHGDVCMSWFRYGAENFLCAPACGGHSECSTGCCYPRGETGACVDVMFCDHARANGHDI